MELLAGDARCIALDLPGFGHSESPPGGFTLDSAADLLAAALRALDAAPAVVCGHSLGGPLAARLAIRHPEAVSRLVLVGPSGLAPAPDWQHRVLRAVPVYNLLQRVPFRVGALAPADRAATPRPARVAGRQPLGGRSGTRAAHRRRRARRARAHTRADRLVRDGPRRRRAPRPRADRRDLGHPRPHGAAQRREHPRASRALGGDPLPARLRAPADGRAPGGVRRPAAAARRRRVAS